MMKKVITMFFGLFVNIQRSIMVLTVLIFIAGCSSRPQLDNSVASAFAETSLPFAVLGVATETTDPSFYAFGGADADRVFEIASMTKAITATAVMQLVEAGKIDLDAPIADVLPEIDEVGILNEDLTTRPGTVPITMRHLLTHTSGFGYWFNNHLISKSMGRDPGSPDFPAPEVVPDGVYDWGFGGLQPRRTFEAGTRWQYSRSLGIAGRVVERVSGLDLDTYFKTYIFGPLRMTRSGYNLAEDIRADQMPMSMRDPVTGNLLPMPSMRPVPMEKFYGGGDLLSTPRDYVRFLQCLVNGGELDGVRIISEASVNAFFENHLPEGMGVDWSGAELIDRGPDATQRSFVDNKDLYSLAWSIEANPDERGNRPQGVGHWSGIFNTYYTVDRERGVVIACFTQLLPFDDAEAYELYRSFEDLVYQAVID